jgi:hypothetical protein
MLRHWRILGLLCLSLLHTPLKAADTYIYNGDTGVFHTYNGQILMNFEPILGAVREVATAISYYNANWAGVAQGLNISAQNNLQVGQVMAQAMEAAGNDIRSFSAIVQGVGTNMNQLHGSVATIAGAANQISGSAQSIQLAFAPLPGKLDELSVKLTVLNSTLGTTFTNAAVLAANNINSNLGFKLDNVTEAIVTNRPNINVTTTNGDVAMNLTNNINVSVPGMQNTEAAATKTLQKSESVKDAAAFFSTPNTTWAGENSSFSSYIQPQVQAVNVAQGFSENFLIFSINAPGGEQSINVNPLHHFPGPIGWFRNFILWASTVLFLIKVFDAAETYYRQMGSVGQLTAPSAMILGNDVGKLAAPIYLGICLAASLAFTAGVVVLLDNASTVSGSGGIMGVLGTLTGDHFAGLGADAVRMLDAFFPLTVLCAQFLFVLTMRPLLIAAWWLYSMVMRALCN